MVDQPNGARTAKAQGPQTLHGFFFLQLFPLQDIVAGADQPVKRREVAHVGDFSRHGLRVFRVVPPVFKKAVAIRGQGRIDQAPHDVGAGVVLVVNARLPLVLWCRWQQDKVALHAVNKHVAPAFKKTQRTQGFNNQLLHLLRWAVRGFALINCLRHHECGIGLLDHVLAHDRFGALAQKLKIAYGRLQLGRKALALLLSHGLRDSLTKRLLLLFAAPRIKAGQRQCYYQHQHQGAQQMQPGQGRCIGC